MKLLDRLEENSVKLSKKAAIEFANKTVNYNTFWTEILKLADYFLKKKFNKICIVEAEQDEYFFYTAMFASLLSGATYIPINSNFPKKRLDEVIKICKADIVITQRKIKPRSVKVLKPSFFKKIKNIKHFPKINSNNDAYIIFTSGSTGKPKGVRISRESLDAYVDWLSKKIFFEKNFRCSQHPGIGFDLSVADIFGTLCSGGTLLPIKKKIDKIFLKRFILKSKISHWVSVPSVVDIIFDVKSKTNEFKKLKKMFFCGETLKKNHLNKIFRSNKKLEVINTYGPTEATVSCTYIKLNFKNYNNFCKPTASFGKPITGINLKFLDKKKKQGQLVISGKQVSEGYLNNNSLNETKFIRKKNIRSFLTGDICKKLDGNFYYLNRIDRQIKIFGNRIELDEIDKVIGDLTNITSHSLAYRNKIITFIKGPFDKKLLLSKLEKQLPNYMLPFSINQIKQWPKNKNYKIDEKKLINLLKNT